MLDSQSSINEVWSGVSLCRMLTSGFICVWGCVSILTDLVSVMVILLYIPTLLPCVLEVESSEVQPDSNSSVHPEWAVQTTMISSLGFGYLDLSIMGPSTF